jgi:hypothetical protein
MFLADDIHAELDAFIADEHRRTGDELPDLMLTLSAERAVKGVFGIAAARFGHGHSVDEPGIRPGSKVNPNDSRNANPDFNMSIGFRSTNTYRGKRIKDGLSRPKF